MTSSFLTAAVWTPSGRGAVATIGVRDDLNVLSERLTNLFRAASGQSLHDMAEQQIHFGRWGHDPTEDVVVCRTERSACEIHCHGGDAAVRRILTDLRNLGCEVVDWQSQASGAALAPRSSADIAITGGPTPNGARFLSGKALAAGHSPENIDPELPVASAIPLKAIATELPPPRSPICSQPLPVGVSFETDCEYADALSRATTLRAAGWIASQAGRMEQALEELAALIAAEQRATAVARANEILSWSNFGQHLTRPWEVVLAGRPNVGKSSLINALVGFERSIVFDEPGTTRDVVTAETALDGWAIRLSDTAGQRGSSNDLEVAGIARAREALAMADARLLLIDISEPPHDDDRRLLVEWPDALIVAHKADLPDAWGESLPRNAIRVSSLRRSGLRELTSAIIFRLIPKLPTKESVIPLTERHRRELRNFL